MDDWAQFRRPHEAEGMPIEAIVRRLGTRRNTVGATLASESSPAHRRAAKGSLADDVEPQARALLRADPKLPATAIASLSDHTPADSRPSRAPALQARASDASARGCGPRT